MLRFALFQPDIAQNVGTILRLGAALDAETHIIEPCGFPLSARGLKRAGMDYLEIAKMKIHVDYLAFENWLLTEKLQTVLLTTKAAKPYTDHCFSKNDVLMVGRESAGVPDTVHAAAHARITIPMASGIRSVNVAVSLAMVAGEAQRQQNIPVKLQ